MNYLKRLTLMATIAASLGLPTATIADTLPAQTFSCHTATAADTANGTVRGNEILCSPNQKDTNSLAMTAPMPNQKQSENESPRKPVRNLREELEFGMLYPGYVPSGEY
jgi:hypothetical protein